VRIPGIMLVGPFYQVPVAARGDTIP